MLKTLVIPLIILCLGAHGQRSAHNGAAKFAPEDGEKLLILGQDLGAVGGLTSHPNGYVDNVEHVPGGVTTYTSLPSLAGLRSQTNWGSGDVNGQAYLNNSTFDNSCIAIGLFINNQLTNIIDGRHDNSIRSLAGWIKEAARPVFLRIGYEFDGPWNGLDPEDFKEAWIHIVEVLDDEGVRNVAYVWQSAGINTANIDRWYPGDEYVNWFGYSHFNAPNAGQSIRDFAEERDKPIMIAEATPQRDLKIGSGEDHWNAWFAPLFESIYTHDRIKALAYINVNWDIQPMWTGQGWGDSRIQVNDFVESQWLLEVNQELWLKGDQTLFETLQYQFWEDYIILGDDHMFIENEIQVSRNDVNWEFSLSSLEVGLTGQAYDLQGKLIFRQPLVNGVFEIKNSIIPKSGMVVRLQSGTKTWTKKILITDF